MVDLAAQRLSLTGYAPARIRRPSAQTAVSPARVSVVIPSYNYGVFLPACLASVLGQVDVDLEVVIVDDASTDGSADIADALCADDQRVRVHRNERNLGHIATYNFGLSQVSGDYVFLLSADDILTPGALGRGAQLLDGHPSVGFAYGWSIPFQEGEPLPTARTRPRSWSIWHGADWVADRCRRAWNVIRSSDAIVRRSVLEKVGGYRPDLPHSGDFEWWMRAALVADVGMVCGVDQLYYRLHGRNMSRTTYASTLTNLQETRKAFDAALAYNGNGGAPRSELRGIAYRRLARLAIELATIEFMAAESESATQAIDDYVRYAVETDPSVVESRQWHALARRKARGWSRARRNPVFRGREFLRDQQAKALWHRWRFSGI